MAFKFNGFNKKTFFLFLLLFFCWMAFFSVSFTDFEGNYGSGYEVALQPSFMYVLFALFLASCSVIALNIIKKKLNK